MVKEHVISVKLLLQWKQINLLTLTQGHGKNRKNSTYSISFLQITYSET